MFVEAEMTQGVWPEVSMDSVGATVLGRWVVQALEEKNQSSLSKSGFIRLLVHVNLQSFRGASLILSLLIASLNSSISWMLPPGLFLLAGDLIRMKSPQLAI